MALIQLDNIVPSNRPQRVVPGMGPTSAKIAIVGEAPGQHEDIKLQPFVGPAGTVLEQCLHAAGLIRSEVYLTNVVKVRPRNNDIAPYFDPRKGFTAAGMEWVEQLKTELAERKPNVVVACGATALAALTGARSILKYRGYFMSSRDFPTQLKVLPCIHPSAALRGMYLYRHLIALDLKKARAESHTPELVRPARQLVYEFGSVSEVLEWLAYYEKADRVCFDIEVLNYELACISFSSSPDIAISVPLTRAWTEQDEAEIWLGIQRVLGNPRSVKVGQNLIFDIHFLLTRCGIVVRGPIEDTMMAHSVMYPEMKKGLEFLVSVYCGTQQYYKDMVKFENIKEES